MITQFREELIDCLRNNILNYWIEKMVDPRGGFYGRRDGFDVLDADAPRGAVLNARILWSFSAAYRVLGDKKYLDFATRAKHVIIDKFYDREFGGIYWSIDKFGNPLDTKKQFYAIGFAIYGLSEYARATNDSEALEYAIRLFNDIENHSRDNVRGGYFEAMTRDWHEIADMRLSDRDANSSKTMNTHLHIIEPYTNLMRVWHNDRLVEATTSLLNVFFDKIVASGDHGHMGLFFDNDWNRQDNEISYGHDIEASWLLLETALVLGNNNLTQKAMAITEEIAEAALEGRMPDGSLIYEKHANHRYDRDRHWWVQAENVIGQVYLAVYHKQPRMLNRAYKSWQYIKDYIIDWEGGEWHWSRKNGEINRSDDKAGFWKCPYHNTRMCLEVYERLANIPD